MKKSILLIVLLVLAIPIISPAIIRIYLEYMPGEMIGSVDGWLSYLGGYSGGFLAFISAYLIYRNDQKGKERTQLVIKSAELTETDDIDDFIVVFTTLPYDQIYNLKRGELTVRYPIFNCSLKNVSPNFANSIRLNLKQGRKLQAPWSYERSFNLYRQYDSIATLESNQTIDFKLQLDPILLNSHEHLDFELSSINLQGCTEVQKVRVYFQKDHKNFVFEHRI
ncbi:MULTISPECIES: hypothetical protein [Pseudoalteromonas]|uniref:hypothetical protein n=1 Tax=Pseudoalteromonas TaxID=53246 RepID=UPI0015FD7747|nr:MULTISPECIES: hypothetical protein [Pseudoalteromonas]MBB1378486.1 hypothetical protein [Pseudoalteromonas sp. SR43-2]MBD0409251.1 hypothetical protein [Pseudoalteromonas distincta]MBH0091033.1 hypothetical protein [Pseudoalteromonas sp. NSLLW218]|tara:strand:- start:165 stop:833 length:669 start_codon:yes stop_codon:yes gene_type:complete